METRISEYEKFIKSKLKEPLSAGEREKLISYHNEMVKNFQHERLIHLMVTLFFGILAIVALIFAGITFVTCNCFTLETLPIYALSGILTILEICYVKHYYFLENHTQRLYEVTKKLYKY